MTSRHPVRRDDDELLGFVVPDGDAWVPTTVFGRPIGPAGDRDHAEDALHAIGLAYLADPWELRTADGEWMTVQVVEAAPDRVSVQVVDFGRPERYGERVVLEAPVGEELRRA